MGKEAEMNPVQFSDRLGEPILIALSRDIKLRYHRVKLVGIEYGGIWIESQEIVNSLLATSGVATHDKTPVVFLPYGQLALVLASKDEVALNEKAFGVEPQG